MSGKREKGFGRAGAVAFLGAFAAILPLLAQGSASAAPPPRPAPSSPISAAFSVRASNGFSIDVESRAGQVRVISSEGAPPLPTFSRTGRLRGPASGNGAASIYDLRSRPSPPRRIEATLGGLGRISVRFHPSGRRRVTRLGDRGPLPCAGKTRIVRLLGTFVGSVEFHGEGGYTSVEARRVRGSIGTPLPRGCAAAARPAGKVVLRARNEASGTRFQAKTTATGVAFLASWRQRLGDGVVVTRRAYAGGPPGSFSFGRGLVAARVSPPAPFSGTGRYRAAGGRHWSGNLRATFPGRTIPLTGPGFRATLEGGG